MRDFRIRKTGLTCATGLAAVFLATAALAAPPGGGKGPGGGRRLEAVVERLGLDAATLAAVDEVLDEARSRRRELRREIHAARDEMHQLLEQPEPDEEAILRQADTIGTLETAARKERLRTLLRVRALLSPDERDRLLELMRQHQPPGLGRQRRGPGPGW